MSSSLLDATARFAWAAEASPWLSLLLLVILTAQSIRILRHLHRGEPLQRLRMLAEQSRAGQRSESENIRMRLAATERALATRLDNLRFATEQRLAGLTLAREQAEGRILFEAKLRELSEQNATRLAKSSAA